MIVLPIQVTHNVLVHSAVAFDVTHGRDAYGRPAILQGVDYTITDFNIQPASDDLVKLLPEGAQSDGTLVAHTRAKLKVAGITSAATNNVQTYVRFNGNIWKTWATQDWNPHTLIGRYILTRYVDVEGVIK